MTGEVTDQQAGKSEVEAPELTSAPAIGLLYTKGIAMGLGDSVPGISGGTIAVITNIYDSLIFSIRAIDVEAAKLVLRGDIAQSWQRINGNFLLIIALGILTGLVISANTVLYLLENQFEVLMGFFIGLVMASSYLLLPQTRLGQPLQILALLLGIIITVGIGFLEPVSIEPSLIYLFFSGAIAICAMILPGLSGAFILLLLGAYQYMLTALVSVELVTIMVFMLGCACGILAFSRLLAWLLLTYHQQTYSLIIGMLLGSLGVLWPWQQVLEVFTDADGEQHVLQTGLVWPLNYTESTGQDPQLVAVIVAALVGGGLVLGLSRLFASKT